MKIINVLLIVLFANNAYAGFMVPDWKNAEGENAVLLHGELYSWNDLTERRNLNPERFDMNHERIGGLIGNEEMLCARFEENPARFTYFHPFLGHLLKDICKKISPVSPIKPCVPPPFCPPVKPDCPPNVVPEPSSFAMVGMGTIFAIFYRKRLYDKS